MKYPHKNYCTVSNQQVSVVNFRYLIRGSDWVPCLHRLVLPGANRISARHFVGQLTTTATRKHMAKIQVSTNVAIGGTSFAATVGTLGKGKGADKVRVIPSTKNPSELITILQVLPNWQILLQKLVCGVFSRHSPGCVTGLPADLTKENLEAGLANESISFSEPDFLEAAAEEVAAERSGKVNPEDTLAEWNEKHLAEYSRLVGVVIHASTSGQEVDASVLENVTRLNIEQAELSAAVSKHEEEKKERAAKRAANKAKAA